MVESGTVGIHALDPYRLSGATAETVLDYDGAGPVHDLGLHDIPDDLAECLCDEPVPVVRNRLRSRGRRRHLVRNLAQTTFSTWIVCGNISTGCTWTIS